MANPNKFTSKEVLNKVLLDSSGNAVTANSVTTQEAMNSVLDTTNNRLNMSLAGGTISGDVTISGDLTVAGSGSAVYDEIIQGSLHIQSASAHSSPLTANTLGDDLVIENSVHAGLSILTPVDQVASIFFGDVVDTARAGFQYYHDDSDERLLFNVAGGEKMRLTAAGMLKIVQGTGFDADSNTTDNIYLNSLGASSGNGNYGASIGFSRVSGGDNKKAAIAVVQDGGDADQTGLSFWTSNETSTSGNATEKLRIEAGGDILIKTADAKIKADSTNTLNIQAHNLKILGSGGEERFHFQSEGNSNPSEFSMKGDTENTMIKLNTNGDSFIHGKSNSAVGFNITAFSTNEGKIPRLRLRHSNSNTVGTDTAVDSGDDLGEIAFQG